MRIIPRLFITLAGLVLIHNLYAQEVNREENYILTPLSAKDEMMLQSLPELKLPAGYENRELPYMVDNSTQIYMRPAYQQDGLSCGQASLVGYAFTYEMARARNLNASLTQNQYPSHFAWNFMNGGDGYYGVSSLHSMQILKEYGMPNVADYGGTMGYGGPRRWLSGYDQYYNGMHNRITRASQIQVGTPEGLIVLKHWLHSHLDDSEVGGVVNFYAQHMSVTTMLPYGTPEAGKYVITTFGGSPNHSMTIVGYNDSIRWDYNSDGQYTNNIDINGDQVVDMKDWEVGGFKMVNSYGGVPNWGNQGYSYMMYKTVADNLGSGGIWNHCVQVLDVKDTYDPKLTAKIILNHNRRKHIKVLAGISNNVNTTEPEVTIGFPIYDFQGGDNYMQGGTSDEANKTIEFGLDLSKLLSYINLNQTVKVFLQVIEQDTANAFTGEIIHFSIFDHTSGGTQYICNQNNVPLNNNDTTTLAITHYFSFDRVTILNEVLPPAPEGEPFGYQLVASGGTEPFIWELDKTYSETHQSASFPMVTAVQLSPSNSTSGMVSRTIDFPFPFYDSSYSSITVHVDGYLMFDQQLYPFPYYQDDKVLFNMTRHISPFLDYHQETSGGGGLWYEGNAESATFRWKTRLTEYPAMIMNYAVKLFPDGTIKFFYGDMNGMEEFHWMAGIGDGDNFNYQEIAGSRRPVINPNTSVTLIPYNYPPELELSESGFFSGTPQQSYGNEQITFKITDNNFIQAKKTLTFSSTGIIVSDSVVSGGDEVIAFGETAWMNVSVLNARPDTLKNATMTIQINDPYITVSDNTEFLGNLPPGQTILFANAFHFDVALDVPNEHLITITTAIDSEAGDYTSNIFHQAFAPLVSNEDVSVNDENGRLDAGDQMREISVSYLNSGGVEVTSLNTLLSTQDPYVTINQNFFNIPVMAVGQTANAYFAVSVDESCPPGHRVEFTVNLSGDGNYMLSDNFTLVVGLYKENFETGDFTLFNWGKEGTRGWTIDTFDAYEGAYCAKSGVITHDEESVLRLDVDVLFDGIISFYRKTSCENDTAAWPRYDYLSFSIDGNELGRWDTISYWNYEEFPITEGFHILEWTYHKDNSTNFRGDAAWVDLITFPSAIACSPVLDSGPPSLDFIMQPGNEETVSILLNNPANGYLHYNADISGIDPDGREKTPGRSIEGSYLVMDGEKFHTGVEYPWNFRTYNAGADNEWIKQIYITFPYGFTLVASSDFTGGSGGAMVFQGPFGNGVTAHWFGEDANGWGVVHLGETAAANVSLIPDLSMSQDITIDFEVKGEVYGGTPHDVFGSIPLRNLGPVQSWLTLNTSNGIIYGESADSLQLTINTTGLADGEYHSWIIIGDNFNHEQVIPVNLQVDTYLGASDQFENQSSEIFTAYPNPFKELTTFTVELAESARIKVDITTVQGQLINSFSASTDARTSTKLSWDGRDLSGNKVPAGIYMAKLICADKSYFLKIIHTK